MKARVTNPAGPAQAYPVNLGPEAQAALETIRREFPAVDLELYLRADLEGDLRDAVADLDVAGTVAGEAIHIGQAGTSTALWKEGWTGVKIVPPATPQPKRPRYAPLPSQPSRTVTLELSEQAAAMLDLLTVHDGHASPEETIRATLASGFTCLAEYLGKDGGPFVSAAFGVESEGEDNKA